MAKSDKLSIATVTVAGVTVKRWWKSREIWQHALGAVLSVVGLVEFLAPQLLPFLPTLGLSPRATLFWIIVLNIFVHFNGAFDRFTSTSIIGGKSDVAEAKATTASIPTTVTDGSK